jgi:polar amino acid transport system substrate-binding protein
LLSPVNPDRARLLVVAAVVAGLLAVLTLSLLLIGCGERDGDGDGNGANRAAGDFTPLHDGVLTVATELPAPGFWDGGGADGRDVEQLTGGFEHDLAAELADRLGLDRVEVVAVPFGQLVAGRARGFDVGLAQVSITHERERRVAFSAPYLTAPVGVGGRAGLDVPDLAEARTLSWGVGRATTELDVVDDRVRPDDEPTVYRTVGAALAAVTRGEVDVAAADWFEVLAAVDAAGKPEVAADRLALVAQISVPQHYGVVLPEGSDDVEAVDSALRALEADRTLPRLRDRLYDRFDVDPDDVPTIEVTP